MPQSAALFCDQLSKLGEGPFWHPLRKELFWFDIPNGMLFGANLNGVLTHQIALGRPASAAALIDFNGLGLSVEGEILRFDIETRKQEQLLPLEADNALTRPNDARVTSGGVWWLSTMGKNAENAAGALYAFARGTLEKLRDNITIPNAICFSPDNRFAYFTDTVSQVIERVEIDATSNLPAGNWEPFIDFKESEGSPDGAITDSAGNLWIALYGGGQVVRYTPEGKFDRAIEVPAPNVTCPALGGEDLTTLFVTTARGGLDKRALERAPFSGAIFAAEVDIAGRPEPVLAL